MLALTLVLGLTLLLGLLIVVVLQPEQPDPGDLGLRGPTFQAAVGDSVALPAEAEAAVASGVIVRPGTRFARNPAARRGESKGERSESESSTPPLAIAPARTVTVAAAEPAPTGSPAPEPQPQATSPISPAPAPAPAATTEPPSGGGEAGQGGPITAGVEPEPVCEGDEYTITAVFLDEGADEEDPRLEIVLLRQGSDGSSEELRLEGDLADVQSLVVKLSGEGGCVTVEIQSSEDEAVPPAAEVGLEAASSGESPEPPLP